jgi:hypothetical protein
MEEIPLVGGNWSDVVRVGDTVRRRHHEGRSDFVTEVLHFLEARGYPYAPRHRGRDEKGRHVLDFIEGTISEHPAERDERAYAEGARMLRLLHDTTAGSELAGNEDCVIHGDVGPFNTIFRDGMPVAFIDWDAASPASRYHDLGYFAWTWCVTGLPVAPVEDQARRLAEVRRGYGLDPRVDLVDVVIRAQRSCAEAWQAAADAVQDGYDHDRHLSAVAWSDRDLAFLLAHETVFRSALE